MLLALLFSMGDIVKQTQSATGYPVIDIYTYAVGSIGGGTALVSALMSKFWRNRGHLFLLDGRCPFGEHFLVRLRGRNRLSDALGLLPRKRPPFLRAPLQGTSRNTTPTLRDFCHRHSERPRILHQYSQHTSLPSLPWCHHCLVVHILPAGLFRHALQAPDYE